MTHIRAVNPDEIMLQPDLSNTKLVPWRKSVPSNASRSRSRTPASSSASRSQSMGDDEPEDHMSDSHQDINPTPMPSTIPDEPLGSRSRDSDYSRSRSRGMPSGSRSHDSSRSAIRSGETLPPAPPPSQPASSSNRPPVGSRSRDSNVSSRHPQGSRDRDSTQSRRTEVSQPSAPASASRSAISTRGTGSKREREAASSGNAAPLKAPRVDETSESDEDSMPSTRPADETDRDHFDTADEGSDFETLYSQGI